MSTTTEYTELVTVTLRLLDPTPLSEDELAAQVEWGWEDSMDFINFHHPLHIGLATDLPEVTDDMPKEQRELIENLRKATDPATRILAKHKALHEATERQSVWFFERPYRPVAAYLLIRKGLLHQDAEGLAEFLRALWEDTESASSIVWDELLDAYPLGAAHDPDGLLDSSGTTKVYRGVGVPRGEIPLDHGASWTTDRAQAEWFARRFAVLEDRAEPYLLIGEVDNDKVLFTTNDRGENEVVSRAVTVHKREKL